MATRVISTSIKLDGETEFKKQMTSVNSELRTLRTEMAYSEEQFKGQANTMEALTAKDKLLRKEIEQQEEKVRALEKAVSDSTEVFGETDKRTDSWRQSLNRAKTDLLKMNRELEDNAKYLDEARNSADHAADSIDEFGREVKDAGDDLGGIGGGIGDFMGKLDDLKRMLVGSVVVVGIKELTGAILEVEESTREYRQIMGTLETSSAAAGYNAEQTAEAYQRLYGVLGDTQTAATTVANLQAIGLSQEDLMVIIDQVTGAWATYGDSIPIDGLSESINETIQSGQVTGVFADVLNWAGTSEDDFNEKLAAASSKAERQNIVMQELAQQGLAETGRAWRENNDDIVAMNEAQSELDEAMGRLGEKLNPLATELKSLGADAINELIDWGEKAYVTFNDDMPKAFYGMVDRLNQKFDEIGTALDDIVEEFKEAGRNVINGFINGVKEKWNSAVSKVSDFVGDIKDVFTGKSGFDEHSPSRWSMTVMEYVMDGLVIGAENRKGKVMETVEDLVDEVKGRFSDLQDVLEGRQNVSDLEYQLWERTAGKTATEAEKLDKKLEILGQQQLDQEGILQGAEAAYQAIAEQYGENSDKSIEFQQTLLKEKLKYLDLLDAIEEVISAKQELGLIDGGVNERAVFSSIQESASAQSGAVTVADLREVAAATVNGMSTAMGEKSEYIGTTVIQIDGQTFARVTQPYFRSEDKSNPEVVSDV